MWIFIVCMSMVLELAAAEEWWELPRTEDEKYLYYVGMAVGAQDSHHLQETAVNRAMSELIREHFGMSVQISESAVEELKGESFQVVTKQSSAPIFLKGTSITKTKEVDHSDGSRYYVQLRADKAALAKSISTQVNHGDQRVLSTYGESHDTKVDVTVKTHPSGATIHFTHLDKRYSVQGQGDAIFYLPRGRYQLVVSKPGYAIHTEEITLEAQGREEVVNLEPIHARVRLAVEPSDADIEYLGSVQRTTEFKLAVAKPHRFRFSHPDYLSQEIELYYQYPVDVLREIELEPKTSTLKYEVDPRNARIEIDGTEPNLVNGRIHLKPGVKRIAISKPGYFTHYETITVSPNRDYPLKVIQLRTDDINTSPTDKKLSYRFDYNPFIYHENRGRLAFVPVALHVEWYYISLGVGHSWVNEKEDPKPEDKIPGSKLVSETDFNDTYATLRLISPRIGPFKFYVGKTFGTVSKIEKNWEDSRLSKKSETYEGQGGGFRFYFRPKWSIHGEYQRIKLEDKETNYKHSQDRFQAGVSYEF